MTRALPLQSRLFLRIIHWQWIHTLIEILGQYGVLLLKETLNLLFLVDLLDWVEFDIFEVFEDVDLVVEALELLLLDVTFDLSGFELIVEDCLDEFQRSLIQFLLFL